MTPGRLSPQSSDNPPRTRRSPAHTADSPAPSRRRRGRSRPARTAPEASGASTGNRRGARTEFAAMSSGIPMLPAVDSFAAMRLPQPLVRRLSSAGVTVPFPIQAATLPNSLAGRDILGRGRTGSGKTLAFGLALLARTAGRRAEPREPLALVLVPTRELAQQVTDALTPYARATQLRLATVVGGVSIGRQAAALRDGAEVVVATPGRLTDLVQRGDCRLDQVAITVLDEADQLADMGFLPQVTRLLDQVARGGQRMLFSATLDRNVDRLVRDYLHDPVVHSVDPPTATVTEMEHHVLHVQETDKRDTTTEIAARDGRVIMFLDTKHAVDRLTRDLLRRGVSAGALHGGKSQARRTRTLTQFRDGLVTVLVATNVAARGIHIADLDLVVNVDPPHDHKDYLHRGGRTARAGASGSVVTLVLPKQRREVARLLAVAGIRPRVTQVRPGQEELTRITGAQAPSGVPITITSTEAAPSRRGRRRGPGRRGRPGSPRPAVAA
ncbi:DEAD/DEAH box helicase [Streptomyces sp. NPDC005438]|uniref:DEAD/DEAH box helicase n=1 Tax=Streptomyces sp. NPDC005438 TaxID=3156880 RepID=UPI00339DCF37